MDNHFWISVLLSLVVGALSTGIARTALRCRTSPPRIELSGEHEVRRVPELCDVYVRIRDESKQPGEAMQRVSATASSFAEQVRTLAPAKLGDAEPRLALDASEATDVPEEFPPSSPEKPVTGWSMQQIRSWSFERTPPRHPDPNDNTEYGKFYVAEASAKITFHDFAELSAFVMELSPLISIDRLAWRLSPGTERGLYARVRQAALRDAIQKAENYAQVLAIPGARVHVTDISDSSSGGGAAPRAMFAAAAPMGRSAKQANTITIEPEPIDVVANIFVKFEVRP
ncbi:hypothetical protein A1Q2_03859 [Trichosporon asahii var. asahii CBS 8904]|uniref:SIMPL domain-containing protein n=1 Tax=Trichosporon asahii var. asahii (strain CBS 8904) TaxID=1220162 RepID=K1VM39_TRIAC|nr:hypothetical protein A1Q2_03859 [Trichosporon asahii var. asahii CBS 8904]